MNRPWKSLSMPVTAVLPAAFLVGALATAAIGWYGFVDTKKPVSLPAPAKPAEAVVPSAELSVAPVEQGVYRDDVPFKAKVVPNDLVFLDAAEGGRVEKVLVGLGDVVTKGQPLIEFSNTSLELDVLDRESRLIASISQLQGYETVLEQNRINNDKQLAQIDYDIVRLSRSLARRSALAEKGAESTELKDQVQDELDYDRKLRPMQAESNKRQNDLRIRQLPEIKGQLDDLQEDLKITRGKLDNLTVRAPVAGRITAIDLKVGENRNRGERLAEITPDTGFRLSAELDESLLGQVHAGQEAKVRLANQDWSLHVARIYPRITAEHFTVDLTFDGAPPGNLLPGQGMSGSIELDGSPGTLMLPDGSYLPSGREASVFVLTADGRSARRQTVKIGRRNGRQVEILSGLAAGEKIVTGGYPQSAAQFLIGG
jgi:HlyD family secretion protein